MFQCSECGSTFDNELDAAHHVMQLGHSDFHYAGETEGPFAPDTLEERALAQGEWS